MEKLELKHLAPYLPYSIKIIHSLIRKDLTAVSLDSDFIFTTTYLGSRSKEMILISDVKPILRPLSDLTKEIDINGKLFTPMIKLLEYQETNHFHSNENLKWILFDKSNIISCEHKKYEHYSSENFIVKYLVKTTNMGVLTYSFTYDSELRRFAVRDETQKKPLGIAFQLDLFQKLFEWNFDIYGLIDKDLAIDINTLK